MQAILLDPDAPPIQRVLVGGTWLDANTCIEVRSPYSGELVSRVASVGPDVAARAVDAAASAMRIPFHAHQRARVLQRAAELVREASDTLARTITLEAGKPISAAAGEVDRAASTLELSAAEALKLTGSVVPMDATSAGVGKVAFTLRVPVGVVGAITPFNFPLNLVAHKVGPALAAGCAVVLKPDEKTPGPALLLADIFQRAGLPAGWLNVVVGPPAPIGDVLVDDGRVALISFTGSAAVGWNLARRAAHKRVKLELGNAAPLIVAEDGDIADAAAKTAVNAFSNAGQSCISVQRVYVHRSLWQAFVDELVPRVENLTAGDPLEGTTDVGPVIDRANRDRILDWIAESGGWLATGGDLTADGIIRPAVVCEPRPDSRLVREEVFGPVCSVLPFDNLSEAVAAANATALGLQAAIFTADYKVALKVASEMQFGAVIVNEAPTWRADQMPYGGVKDSGNTREGPAYSVLDMTEERLVVLTL